MAGNVERKSSVLLFAEFFKGYGIALGIIIAAIPFVSSSLDLLPNYSANKDILTFFTSLFSLMAVAILFSIRRHIGNRVFPPARRVLSPREYRYKKWFGIIIPCIFACVSFLSLITYLEILDRSVDQVALDFSFVDDGSGPITLSEGLENKEKLTAWSNITKQEIKRIERKLNNRPRKRHKFETPLEVMDKILFNSEVAFIT